MTKKSWRGPSSLFLLPAFQLLLAGLLLFALSQGQRELAVLSFLLLALGTGARLWTAISQKGLALGSTVDRERVMPGEKITLGLHLANDKVWPVWVQVKAPLPDALLLAPAAGQLATRGSLLWYQKAQVTWELTAVRRGVQTLGPFKLQSGDIFDFFAETTEVSRCHEVLVYPRLAPLGPLYLPKSELFGVPGPKNPVQDPAYILGTREYSHGQPARHIHWKASARHDRLQEKVFESTRHEKVLLTVDVASFRNAVALKEFERALEVVAAVASRLDRQGHPVGLSTDCLLAESVPAAVPVGRTTRQLALIMDLLARLTLESALGTRDPTITPLAHGQGTTLLYFAYGMDETARRAKERYALQGIRFLFFLSTTTPESDMRQVRSLEALRLDGVRP